MHRAEEPIEPAGDGRRPLVLHLLHMLLHDGGRHSGRWRALSLGRLFGLLALVVFMGPGRRGETDCSGQHGRKDDANQNHVLTPMMKLQPPTLSPTARRKSAVSPKARSYCTPT